MKDVPEPSRWQYEREKCPHQHCVKLVGGFRCNACGEQWAMKEPIEPVVVPPAGEGADPLHELRHGIRQLALSGMAFGLKESEEALDALSGELARLRQENTCSTCGGTPPVSGLPCVCGGSNKAWREAAGLREIAFDLQVAVGEFPALAHLTKYVPIAERDALRARLASLSEAARALTKAAHRVRFSGSPLQGPTIAEWTALADAEESVRSLLGPEEEHTA